MQLDVLGLSCYLKNPPAVALWWGIVGPGNNDVLGDKNPAEIH